MILALETSCDETGAAVVEKDKKGVRVVSNVVASSVEMHIKYGGVVPEIAAREQLRVIGSVIDEARKNARVDFGELTAVAVANGPGLMGSLLTGVETAKTLAYVFQKPLLAVNHLQAHVLANWIGKEPELPGIGLVVSGGHTDLIWLKSLTEWVGLGGTKDDAAGECLDKCARAIGLPYPGGVAIQEAAEGAEEIGVNLPRPLINSAGYEMSFSGLKAAVLREVKKIGRLDDRERAGLAREINEAVAESLASKTVMALQKIKPKSLLLAGGVAANRLLRERLEKEGRRLGVKVYMPEIKYCTDNAAMVGAAAVMRPVEADGFELRPDPGLGVV